jgi:hypothetical protein
METSADKEMNIEMIEKEEMVNNIANTIRGVFESAGEVVSWIMSITPHSFIVIMKGDNARITWEPKFVIIHIAQEYPLLIEAIKAFTEAIGFPPCCKYIEHGLTVIEWAWLNSEKRFTELESAAKLKRIYNLKRIGIRNINLRED